MKANEIAKELNKLLGEDTVTMGSSVKIERIPTGVLPVDYLLDGGLPKNRFTEIYGDYSTLKSYVAYKAIAETQKNEGTTALVDTEHSFDPEWAKSLGVDVEELIYLTPQNGEEAVDVTEVLLRQEIDLIVWDSVAALLPQSEEDKREKGVNHQPARLAALMSKGLRKLTAANKSTAVLMINQTRLNVGQIFGNPETVPGGKALPFYAAYRIALRKAGKETETVDIWDGEKTVKSTQISVQKIRAKIEKSKMSKPYREIFFDFDLKNGSIDELAFIISVGLENDLILREGVKKWKIATAEKAIVGYQNFKTHLIENPKEVAKLRKQLTNLLGK